MLRSRLLLAAVLLAACSSFPGPQASNRWLAQLSQSDQLLWMELEQDGSSLSGEATLAHLTQPGSEALGLRGTRQADTISIDFLRDNVPSFRFTGRYLSSSRLTGTLTGAEFAAVGVLFLRQ